MHVVVERVRGRCRPPGRAGRQRRRRARRAARRTGRVEVAEVASEPDHPRSSARPASTVPASRGRAGRPLVVGQVHQFAAGAAPGQQGVTVGRPLLRAEVELRILEAERDLEPRRLGKGQRQRAASEREAEQPAAVAVELNTIVQRNARDRAAEGLLDPPGSTPRSSLARSWLPLASFTTRSRRRSRSWRGLLRGLPARGQGVGVRRSGQRTLQAEHVPVAVISLHAGNIPAFLAEVVEDRRQSSTIGPVFDLRALVLPPRRRGSGADGRDDQLRGNAARGAADDEHDGDDPAVLHGRGWYRGRANSAIPARGTGAELHSHHMGLVILESAFWMAGFAALAIFGWWLAQRSPDPDGYDGALHVPPARVVTVRRAFRFPAAAPTVTWNQLIGYTLLVIGVGACALIVLGVAFVALVGDG